MVKTLETLIATARTEADQFAAGKKIAAGRLRKALQEIKA